MLPKGEYAAVWFFSVLELTPVASWFVYTASVIDGQYTNSHSYLVMGARCFPWLTGDIFR